MKIKLVRILYQTVFSSNNLWYNLSCLKDVMTMKKDERIRQLEAELEAKNTVIESLKQELNYVREQLVLYKKHFMDQEAKRSKYLIN